MKKSHLLIICAALFMISCGEENFLNDNVKNDIESIEGTFYITVADRIENGIFIEEYHESFIENSKTGEIQELYMNEEEFKQYKNLSGKNVLLEGKLENSNFIATKINSKENTITTDRGKGGTNPSVLVVMVTDNNTTPLCSTQNFVNQLVGATNTTSAANLFTESSYGRFTIGEVSTVSVTIPQVTCSTVLLKREIEPILEELGLNTFDYYMYVTGDNCLYGGAATINGNVMHIDDCWYTVAAPHELGHCLGLYHSHSQTVSSGGIFSEYGDPACIMGVRYNEFNALQRYKKGWIPNKHVKNIKNSGTYKLIPLETDGGRGSKILRIDLGVLINGLYPEQYYLSYRAPIGAIDANLDDAIKNKLSIHSGGGSIDDLLSSKFLDGIGLREVFSDPANGLKITNLGIVDEELSVLVEIL